MKISKLFHWLYAILMFLPILVFIPNAFYYGFNELAVAQEKTEQVPVYYESNEVTSLNDLVIGNVYTIRYQDLSNITQQQLIYCSHIWIHGGYTGFNNGGLSPVPNIRLVSNYLLFSVEAPIQSNLTNGYLDFIYSGQNNLDYSLIEECTNQYIKEYQPIVTNMSITDSMVYAWHSTWQNDLFSWSYDSFLTQPFIYITNLFNVPATNTLLYCLSYWLNISIIWLCFDVVVYVPLLVHRWLDKGIIE